METVRLYLADIRYLTQRETDCMALLSPKRRTEAQRYRQQEERLRNAAAGLLLRRVLGVRSDEQLRYNEYGRPELADGTVQFNLSHGGCYAVLAVSRNVVGVDVEPVGERPPVVIPRRYLTPDELGWLEEDPSPERFAWLWTRLESVLKADGRGFTLEGREFSVLESGCPWYLETFDHNGHTVSCAAATPFEIQFNELTAEELLT